MASIFVSKPGTEFGPCADECNHTDCAELRSMAEALCKYCKKPVGYNRRFYKIIDGSFVHELCELRRIKNER